MAFENTIAGKIVNDVGDRTGINDLSKGIKDGDPDLIINSLNTLRGGPRPYLVDNPIRDAIVEANSSFSGTDCIPIAQVNDKLIMLGNVATFSYSIFREKSPVRTLGRSYAKGYTAGPRTIAGSIIFIVFDRNPLYEILNALDYDKGPPNDRYSTPVADQIPPIDLILWFSNEYGHKSVLRLYGVEFLQEGQTHSINDLYTENVMQYVAKDMDVLLNYKDVEGFRNLLYERQISGQFTDNHLTSMLEYQKKIQQQITDVNVKIHNIQQERGKRGLVTFGISELPFANKDLKREYEKQLKIKSYLVLELDKINTAIIYHQENVYGWNPGTKAEATMGHDRLAAEKLTSGANLQPSSTNMDSPEFIAEYNEAVRARTEYLATRKE